MTTRKKRKTPYKTPKICYTKAPVRRETEVERYYRRKDQMLIRER